MSKAPEPVGEGDGAMNLVSSCLAGISCRWDGRNCLRDEIRKLVAEGKAIAICPEELGGLRTPRPPAEIVGGDGHDVLDGKAKVVNKFGRDVTNEFIKGAQESLRIAKQTRARRAILKARSTSCGFDQIYDGTFSHKLRKGSGVACAALRRAGIEVITEEMYLKGGTS